jgi:hypothetical protein
MFKIQNLGVKLEFFNNIKYWAHKWENCPVLQYCKKVARSQICLKFSNMMTTYFANDRRPIWTLFYSTSEHLSFIRHDHMFYTPFLFVSKLLYFDNIMSSFFAITSYVPNALSNWVHIQKLLQLMWHINHRPC